MLGDNEADYLTLEDIKQYPEYQTVKKIYDSLPSKDTRVFAFDKDGIYITDQRVLFKIKVPVSPQLIGNPNSQQSLIKQCNNLFQTAKSNKNISSETTINPKEAAKTVVEYNKFIPELGEDYYFVLNYRKNDKIAFKYQYIKSVFSNLKDKSLYEVYLSFIHKDTNILFIDDYKIEVLLCSVTLNTWENMPIVDLPTGYFVDNKWAKEFILYLEKEIPENNIYVEGYYKKGDIDEFNRRNTKSKIFDKLYTILTGNKSKAVFYDIVTDKSKLDLFRFVCSKDDLRPAMENIGYRNGYVAASNVYVLVWVKDQYIKAREGKCYDKLDRETEYIYPDFFKVIPNLNTHKHIQVQIDTKQLGLAVKMAKKLPKYPNQVVKLNNGAYFDAKRLESMLYFLEFCTDPQIYLVYDLVDDYIRMLYITDKNGIHNILVMAYLWKEIDYYVNNDILKYCVHLSNIDKNKILPIIKDNYINLDILKSEFELLDNNQENTNTNGLMGLSDYQKKSQNILGYIKNKLTLSGSKVYPKFAVGSLIRYGEYFDGTVYKIVDTNTEGYEVIDISMPKYLRSRNTIPFSNNDLLVECNIQTLELLCEL